MCNSIKLLHVNPEQPRQFCGTWGPILQAARLQMQRISSDCTVGRYCSACELVVKIICYFCIIDILQGIESFFSNAIRTVVLVRQTVRWQLQTRIGEHP